jgi:hypothetical protein
VTAVGAAAAAMVAVPLTAVVSFDVFTEIVLLPVEVVFVIPSSFSEVAVLLPSAQVWPLAFANVIVTVVEAVAAVAVQIVAKVLGLTSTTPGLAGIVPPVQVGKVTVIVPPAASDPVVLVVKLTFQFAYAPAASDDAVAVTALTDGSIVYGSESLASFRRNRSHQPVCVRPRSQRACAGVMSRPLGSSTVAGAMRNEDAFPPVPNQTPPSGDRCGVIDPSRSRHRHVRTP